MAGIKFYSEYDMACGWELEKIIEKVNNKTLESKWSITDVLDFHNVLKYISIERFSNHIVYETGIGIETYEKRIRQKIGIFIGCHKDVFINLYDEIDFDNTDDFFEVFENYKLYHRIEITDFRRFLEKENVQIYTVLKFKRLAEYFDEAVKDVLLSDPTMCCIYRHL